MVYHIIEVANSHGGSLEYLFDLVNSFDYQNNRKGIKFQPLSADTLATSDFEWYPTYQKLEFSREEWTDIIRTAGKHKDIWLDIFDIFGVFVLGDNLAAVHGIKFQSSVLNNREVFKKLATYDLSEKKIILNIAARSIEEIKEIINYVSRELEPAEILLEFGFQGYPTDVRDSGLSKIKILKEHFDNRLVFADHVDGASEEAVVLPSMAVVLGVEVIEKHVMLDNRPTEYDHFSSLTPDRYRLMVRKTEEAQLLIGQPFINEREELYLKKTLMIPILADNLEKGRGINLHGDLLFRRSGKEGLTILDIEKRIDNFEILAKPVEKGNPLQREDFKKADIAVVAACRLKSSRLPRKALLKIGSLTSVEFCLSNAVKFQNINHVILATSDNDEDYELRKYTYAPSVIFHRGDPEDVIRRYIDIADKLGLDVIIRITADMPFVDNEICEILLQRHFATGADYTTAKEAAVGTNLEVINVSALRKVKSYFANAEYSEYMTWYFQNNPEYFRLNFVDLPEALIRNYRLTLDYEEDLVMFNKIADSLGDQNYSLRDVFHFLDNNADVSSLNSHLTLKYRTDETLISLLNEKTKMK